MINSEYFIIRFELRFVYTAEGSLAYLRFEVENCFERSCLNDIRFNGRLPTWEFRLILRDANHELAVRFIDIIFKFKLCCLLFELHLQTLFDRSMQLIIARIVMVFYSVKHKSIQIGLVCLRCMQSHFFIVGETKV